MLLRGRPRLVSSLRGVPHGASHLLRRIGSARLALPRPSFGVQFGPLRAHVGSVRRLCVGRRRDSRRVGRSWAALLAHGRERPRARAHEPRGPRRHRQRPSPSPPAPTPCGRRMLSSSPLLELAVALSGARVAWSVMDQVDTLPENAWVGSQRESAFRASLGSSVDRGGVPWKYHSVCDRNGAANVVCGLLGLLLHLLFVRPPHTLGSHSRLDAALPGRLAQGQRLESASSAAAHLCSAAKSCVTS